MANLKKFITVRKHPGGREVEEEYNPASIISNGYDRILFPSNRDPDDAAAGTAALYVVGTNGLGIQRVTPKDTNVWAYNASWEPTKRKKIVYTHYRNDPGDYNIAVFDTEIGETKILADPTLNGRFPDGYGAFNPAYSPDGQTIVFSFLDAVTSAYSVWLMNANGSNKRQIIGPVGDEGLTEQWFGVNQTCWSPDGSKLLVVAGNFNAPEEPSYIPVELWMFDADGSNGTKILDVGDLDDGNSTSPYIWSVSWGSKDLIAVAMGRLLDGESLRINDVFTLRPDGSELTQVTNEPQSDTTSYDGWSQSLCWSPDGTRLVGGYVFNSTSGFGDMVTSFLELDGTVRSWLLLTEDAPTGFASDIYWGRASDKVPWSTPSGLPGQFSNGPEGVGYPLGAWTENFKTKAWWIDDDGYESGISQPEPPDESIEPGQWKAWYDDTDGAAKYKRKARTADGTIVVTSANMTPP